MHTNFGSKNFDSHKIDATAIQVVDALGVSFALLAFCNAHNQNNCAPIRRKSTSSIKGAASQEFGPALLAQALLTSFIRLSCLQFALGATKTSSVGPLGQQR